MNRIPGDIDRLAVVFDEESLVSDAGLLAAGTLMKRLGLEGAVGRYGAVWWSCRGVPPGPEDTVFGGFHAVGRFSY